MSAPGVWVQRNRALEPLLRIVKTSQYAVLYSQPVMGEAVFWIGGNRFLEFGGGLLMGTSIEKLGSVCYGPFRRLLWSMSQFCYRYRTGSCPRWRWPDMDR